MGDEASKLREIMERAIADLKITTTEYEAIMNQADADGVIDNEERALLKQLNEMISNKTIERVP